MIGVKTIGPASAIAFCAALPAHAQLYTTYSFSQTGFSASVCGSIPGESGCFGGGGTQTFGHLCAVTEDESHSKSGSYGSKQRLYFMDSNATGKNDVTLHVIEKVITVEGENVTVAFNKVANISLPLTGGSACQIAANDAVIVAGTTSSTTAALVVKKTRAVSSLGGFSPPINLSAITSDPSGYISVNFGTGNSAGFYLIGPDGRGLEDGGGNQYVIPGENGFILP